MAYTQVRALWDLSSQDKFEGVMNKTVKNIFVIAILIFTIASLTACNSAEQYFVLGTILQVDAEGRECSKTPDAVYRFMNDAEDVLSPTIEGSDIYNINHADVGVATKCNDLTMRVLKIAQKAYEYSNGAYDPSVYPLVRFYKMSGDTFVASVLKDDFDFDKLPAVLERVGLSKCFEIDYENSTVIKLVDGAMLDLGGVAKGYCVDKARDLCSERALINLGGNISAKGKSYSIGIANPDRIDREIRNTPYFAKLTLNDGECIATSGDYQRYYVYGEGENRKIYHHLINPLTGMCADTGIASCSVISQDGALGDAIATAVVVMGYDKGVEMLNELGLSAVIVFDDFSYKTVGDISVELR